MKRNYAAIFNNIIISKKIEIQYSSLFENIININCQDISVIQVSTNILKHPSSLYTKKKNYQIFLNSKRRRKKYYSCIPSFKMHSSYIGTYIKSFHE